MTQVLPKMTQPQAKWVDEKTGLPSKEYFEWMQKLENKVRELEARIAALEP